MVGFATDGADTLYANNCVRNRPVYDEEIAGVAAAGGGTGVEENSVHHFKKARASDVVMVLNLSRPP